MAEQNIWSSCPWVSKDIIVRGLASIINHNAARVLADNLVDSKSKLRFFGADMSTKLKLLGVEVGSIGDAHGKTDGALSYVYTDPKLGNYKKLVVSANGKKLLGAVLVGDTSNYDTLLQYVLNDSTVR